MIGRPNEKRTAPPQDAELDFGPRVVPIVADEARTFGIANLKQIGIYSSAGQTYEL